LHRGQGRERRSTTRPSRCAWPEAGGRGGVDGGALRGVDGIHGGRRQNCSGEQLPPKEAPPWQEEYSRSTRESRMVSPVTQLSSWTTRTTSSTGPSHRASIFTESDHAPPWRWSAGAERSGPSAGDSEVAGRQPASENGRHANRWAWPTGGMPRRRRPLAFSPLHFLGRRRNLTCGPYLNFTDKPKSLAICHL
jgi:hypothetical protein